MFENRVDRRACEQLTAVPARDADAVRDVRLGFRSIQRRQDAAERHTLLELPKRRLVQTIGELGLTDHHDRQQLVACGLDVRQETNLFHELVRQTLRFVDDQRGGAAGFPACQQRSRELEDETGLRGFGPGVEAEAPREKLEELAARQKRIAQVDGARVIGTLLFERGVHQRRLAGTGVTDEDSDAFAAGDAVVQMAQRLAMLRGQKQVPWVWRQVERPLPESVVALVHACSAAINAPPPSIRALL